jgi:hypothetical protein
MLWRSRSLQHGRKNRSDKCEQKQKSGGQTLHYFPVNQNPKLSLSIKQKDWQGKVWQQERSGFYFSNKSRLEQKSPPHRRSNREATVAIPLILGEY